MPPREIARSLRDSQGMPVVGPLNYPIVYKGRLVWAQATNVQTQEVTLYA